MAAGLRPIFFDYPVEVGKDIQEAWKGSDPYYLGGHMGYSTDNLNLNKLVSSRGASHYFQVRSSTDQTVGPIQPQGPTPAPARSVPSLASQASKVAMADLRDIFKNYSDRDEVERFAKTLAKSKYDERRVFLNSLTQAEHEKILRLNHPKINEATQQYWGSI